MLIIYDLLDRFEMLNPNNEGMSDLCKSVMEEKKLHGIYRIVDHYDQYII